jgi:hypothetical protein
LVGADCGVGPRLHRDRPRRRREQRRCRTEIITVTAWLLEDDTSDHAYLEHAPLEARLLEISKTAAFSLLSPAR